jgi:urease beta subunit
MDGPTAWKEDVNASEFRVFGQVPCQEAAVGSRASHGDRLVSGAGVVAGVGRGRRVHRVPEGAAQHGGPDDCFSEGGSRQYGLGGFPVPKSLVFPAKGAGPIGLNLTSAGQTVTVKNTGTAPLQLDTGNCGYDVNPCTEGSYSGDYTFATNSCGINTIPIGGTCTFSVEFTPSTTNQEVGTVSVYDNTGNGPLSVTLTGHGTAGQATVSPAGLSFFTKSVGTTSAARTVTVKNTGTAPLQLDTGNCGYDVNPCTEGSYSGDYSISANSCGINTIAVGTTCTFSVDFTPSTSNEETGSINIYDNAVNSPQSISLTGLATSATVSVSSASLTFPAAGAAPVGLGETSPAQTVTVTNTGKVPVQMGFASPSGDDPSISSTYANDFAVTSDSCAGNTIPAGTTCTFSVTFTPSTLNDEIGTLDIYGNTVTNPQQITLQGTIASGGRRLGPR